MSAWWRYLTDVTYPMVAWFTGHSFNRALWRALGERMVEDLWLPYYCVSTDLTHSQAAIHWRGILWRYVRASMTLAGFLPPLADQGRWLVDGGYVNNLPVNVMQDWLASTGSGLTIIAVDVGREAETQAGEWAGDTISGWWVLLGRWLGFSSCQMIPTLADIQTRLAYVSCEERLQKLRQAAHPASQPPPAADNINPTILLIRPPVQSFGNLDFGHFEAILQAGQVCGQETVQDWRNSGLLHWLQGNRPIVSGNERMVRMTMTNTPLPTKRSADDLRLAGAAEAAKHHRSASI